jgi:hypothetical protein
MAIPMTRPPRTSFTFASIISYASSPSSPPRPFSTGVSLGAWRFFWFGLERAGLGAATLCRIGEEGQLLTDGAAGEVVFAEILTTPQGTSKGCG